MKNFLLLTAQLLWRVFVLIDKWKKYLKNVTRSFNRFSLLSFRLLVSKIEFLQLENIKSEDALVTSCDISVHVGGF